MSGCGAGFLGISSRQLSGRGMLGTSRSGSGYAVTGVRLLRSAYYHDAGLACQMGVIDRQLGLAECTSFRTLRTSSGMFVGRLPMAATRPVTGMRRLAAR